MRKSAKQLFHRGLAFLMTALVLFGTLGVSPIPVHAADGTLEYRTGKKIGYGSYFTTEMFIDGSNLAYCVQPLKKTPPAGTYSYDLLGQDSDLRKALYYLRGGYGYEKNIKEQYLGGWSDDNQYVIGHLVTAYVYAGYDADNGAFHGAPQEFIDKSIEIANAIKGLPNPPSTFRAFIIPSSTNQTIAGSWYQVPYGSIELYKSSGNPGVSDGNPNYSLAGAQYGLFHGDSQITVLTTDEKGYAKADNLEVLEEGDYYTIRELSASPGFAIDTESYNVTVKPEETSTVKVKEIPQNQPLDLLLKKLDADLKDSQAQGSGSLENAEFTVKFYTEISDTDPAQAGKEAVRSWVFKTDKSGTIKFTKDYFVSGDDFYYASDGKTVCLPLGTVTVQETKAPAGYHLNDTVFVQKITSSGDGETISVYNAPDVEDQIYRGGVKIQKRDLETSGNTPQGGATLSGAKFSITTLNEQPVVVNGKSYEKDQVVLTLETDQNGLASTASDTLPVGHYRVDEITPPTGYLGEGTLSREFDVTKNGEIVDLTGENTSIFNQIIRGGVKIQKRDAETGDATAQGGATLMDAVFTITTLNENPVLVGGKSYEKDQVVLTLKTDKTGIAATEADVLPYGHYRIDEITPPSGYLGEGIISREFDIQENGIIVDMTAKESAILNQPIRGDLEFVKVSDGDLNRLAGVPFSITSKTTGESHTIVTDRNGYASTSAEWNPHTQNTNEGKTDQDGIWFGTTEPDNEKGALLYDTYILEEQRCETNEGMNLLKIEVEVYRNNVVIDLGTLTDDQITIATTALDQDTDSHFSHADEKITIVDTVEYEGLQKGTEYKLVGTLMDAETGKELLIDEKAVTSETTFKAKKSTGSVKVKFTFDGSSLKGKTLVVFETLYQDDLKLAVHADLDDRDQTLYFPELGTQAKDSDTGMQISYADKKVELIDTVSYSNLLPGEEYTLIGTLMDVETGEALEVDGKPITAKATFTPEEPNGTTEVHFTFDGSELAGKTVVVFESLTFEGKEICAHKDLQDKGQTIQFPKLSTQAMDDQTGQNLASPSEKVTITDTVEYKNLIPGKEYTIQGILMDQESEEELLIDGKPVTAQSVFTPESSEGTVQLSFSLNASTLAGKTTVAFETLQYEEKTIAVHADIKDEKQSIYFPKIGTTAKDAEDGDQTAVADEEVSIIDTVSYSNLVPGLSYKLVGTLMDKETGKAVEVDGTAVTAEATFTPEKSSGSVDVTFTWNASGLSGHSVVVFEKLFLISGETEVFITSHEDLEDKGQTIELTEVPKEVPPENPQPSAPVKTGDDTNTMIYVVIAAVSSLILIGAGGYFIYRRKNKK